MLCFQPNYEFLEREVEKRKVALQEAKLKAKGLNPDGTPALSTLGGFSPASKPGTTHEDTPSPPSNEVHAFSCDGVPTWRVFCVRLVLEGSPNVMKADEKSPNPQLLKSVKKEAEDRAQGSKSPHNG